jgi:hypothetical protein
MGVRRSAKFSRNARTLACGNRLFSPKVGISHDRAWSPPRADDPDWPRLLHDDLRALSISAPHPVVAPLVVGPDDVRDVGVGNERYDAVASSGKGVGSEVDAGHSKSFPGPFRKPFVAHSAPAPEMKPSDQPSRAEAPCSQLLRGRPRSTRPPRTRLAGSRSIGTLLSDSAMRPYSFRSRPDCPRSFSTSLYSTIAPHR